MDIKKNVIRGLGLILVLLLTLWTITISVVDSFEEFFIFEHIKNIHLNSIYFYSFLITILIIEILILKRTNDKDFFHISTWTEILKKAGGEFQQFSINNVGKARVIIVMALLTFLFSVNNIEILNNNTYLTSKNIYYLAGLLLVFSITIVVVTSFKTEGGHNMTVGGPAHFTESITLVTVPLIFMFTHPDEYIIVFSIYAILVGMFYNLIWLVQFFSHKISVGLLVKQGLIALLITSISYFIFPIIKFIGNDIKMTVDSILDDTGYKKDYYYIITNFKNIENNLKVIKDNVPKFSKNISRIQKDLNQCLYYTNKIERTFKQSFYYPSTDILKNYNEVKHDYASFVACYNNLNRSIMMLKDKKLISSTKEAIVNIDKSIYNINTSLQKFKPNKVVVNKSE